MPGATGESVLETVHHRYRTQGFDIADLFRTDLQEISLLERVSSQEVLPILGNGASIVRRGPRIAFEDPAIHGKAALIRDTYRVKNT